MTTMLNVKFIYQFKADKSDMRLILNALAIARDQSGEKSISHDYQNLLDRLAFQVKTSKKQLFDHLEKEERIK
jgi:hypothetical protein